MNANEEFKPDPAIQLLLQCVSDGGPFVRQLMTKVIGSATRVWDAVEAKQNPKAPEAMTATDHLLVNIDWADKAIPAQLEELQTMLGLVAEVQFALDTTGLVIHAPKKAFEWKPGSNPMPGSDHDGLGLKPLRPLSDYLKKPHPLADKIIFRPQISAEQMAEALKNQPMFADQPADCQPWQPPTLRYCPRCMHAKRFLANQATEEVGCCSSCTKTGITCQPQPGVRRVTHCGPAAAVCPSNSATDRKNPV